MQTVLFVIALSVDVFLASAACGMDQIKIEIKTALCISGICSGVLFFSLAAGNFFSEVLTEAVANVLCFAGLLLIGIYKLTEYAIRRYIRKYKYLCKRIKITFSQLTATSQKRCRWRRAWHLPLPCRRMDCSEGLARH